MLINMPHQTGANAERDKKKLTEKNKKLKLVT